MSEKDYAFIKEGKVINIAVFNDPSEELLNHFKSEFNLDEIILATENAGVNGSWDGVKFILPQPFPSWTLNGSGEWKAPVEEPFMPGKIYLWNESDLSWEEHDL